MTNSNGEETPPPPNYNNDFSWVAKPNNITRKVDVFFVCPTVYSGKRPVNMDITDSQMRGLFKGPLYSQATVFTQYANLFSPFYRQQSMATLEMSTVEDAKAPFLNPVFRLGYSDVEKAFDYYIKHLNNGRPFIIAGHSQGSMALIELMRNRFKNNKLQKQLVAAYLIGYSVTKDDLKKYPWMKIAQNATDKGKIITFNTQARDAKGSPVLLKGAISINPLNWKTDSTPATNKQNIAANFISNKSGKLIEKIPSFAGAYVDTATGALIATKMKDPTSNQIDLDSMGNWPKGIYHRYDYAFWFENLKENVKLRIEAYLKERSGL